MFLQTFTSVQKDPVCRGSELVWGALHGEAFPPENGQPMIGYYPGRSDSDAATWGMKWLEVSMSLLEGVVPASNPRRLHLMCWTQSLSEVKVSYLLGRMSSFIIPLGRTASRGGRLSSFSSVARFFGGDEHGLLSSKGRFWFQTGSTFDVEAA